MAYANPIYNFTFYESSGYGISAHCQLESDTIIDYSTGTFTIAVKATFWTDEAGAYGGGGWYTGNGVQFAVGINKNYMTPEFNNEDAFFTGGIATDGTSSANYMHVDRIYDGNVYKVTTKWYNFTKNIADCQNCSFAPCVVFNGIEVYSWNVASETPWMTGGIAAQDEANGTGEYQPMRFADPSPGDGWNDGAIYNGFFVNHDVELIVPTVTNPPSITSIGNASGGNGRKAQVNFTYDKAEYSVQTSPGVWETKSYLKNGYNYYNVAVTETMTAKQAYDAKSTADITSTLSNKTYTVGSGSTYRPIMTIVAIRYSNTNNDNGVILESNNALYLPAPMSPTISSIVKSGDYGAKITWTNPQEASLGLTDYATELWVSTAASSSFTVSNGILSQKNCKKLGTYNHGVTTATIANIWTEDEGETSKRFYLVAVSSYAQWANSDKKNMSSNGNIKKDGLYSSPVSKDFVGGKNKDVIWVYNNGAWHKSDSVYVYNNGWKKASSISVYNGGWKTVNL